MKQIYLLPFLVFCATYSIAQPCLNGRYASEVFPNYTLTSNISYGSNTSFSGSTTNLRLDFYEPTGDVEPNRPLILWVHGGSFLGGSKTDPDMTALSQRFARKGFACASVDYRLGFFPIDSANAVKAVVRAVQDLKAAIRFFYKDKQNNNTYRIDTNHIYIGGSSAGAITSLHVAYLNDECEISGYLSQNAINQLGGLDGNSGNPGYSSSVKGVINMCGALAKYVWLEAGDVPLVSIHGTLDGTVKYNRGIVNPGTALMYLDGSRILHERACAVNVSSDFYTFTGAGHCPYIGNAAYMDTTERFIRDFMVNQLGCNEVPLQIANAPLQQAILYASTYCDGSPANETCIAGVEELMASENAIIYPNPSNGLSIFAAENAVNQLDIYDAMGRKIYSITGLFKEKVLEIENLQKGTYWVRFQLENGTVGVKQWGIQ
ncbi:MAG: alpha/beta hydrolase fold domain-containing protein [Bacteroidetes bacterium]|nr:alpha/beta hydrolase fold domain-containing protein [Bacteroidota bacterium]